MIVLGENIRLLCAIGIFNTNGNRSTAGCKEYAFNLLLSIPISVTIGSMVVFFIDNASDTAKATKASYAIFALSMYLIIYWIFAVRTTRFRAVIDKLQAIVEKRESQRVFGSYQVIEAKSTKYSRILFQALLVAAFICLAAPFMLAPLLLAIGKYTTNIWFLPYPSSTPYDQSTVFGYLVTWLVQTMGGFSSMAVAGATNGFYFAVCWYIEGLIDDVVALLRDIDATVEFKKMDDMRQEFGAIVQFHNDVIGIMDDFNECFQSIIFVTFVLSVLWMCSAMFQLQNSMYELDYLLCQCMITLLTVTANVFIYCYFGQKITTKFAEISEAVYVSHWYEYPVGLQKYALLMLIRSQRPFYISGYFILSTLATFKAIINNAVSYFMVLRNI